jgi:hypothetical protein
MLDSLEIESLLISLGFRQVETKTHAVGFHHPSLGERLVYLKDGRGNIAARRKAVRKQPLVVHPFVLALPGFEGTRVAALSPNRQYMNGNMSTFPNKGASATGVAMDIPDVDALRELLELMGMCPGASLIAAPAAPSSETRRTFTSVVTASLPATASSEQVSPTTRRAKGAVFKTAQAVRFADHCCQGIGELKAGSFAMDDLTMQSEGSRRLRFAPLGNRPEAPRVALVGITPGGQIERFASLLATESVESAAKLAAFHGKQTEIKQLLAAHGFAERVGISLEGDLNDNPDILTTSVVKCCLMVDEGYKFAAPDIAASAAATRCATERLVGELRSSRTLRWVVIFGKPAWDALHELRIAGDRIIDVLRAHGLVVLQFPHFAQNFQQRVLFACNDAEEKELLDEKPDHAKYAGAARAMRSALLRELAPA